MMELHGMMIVLLVCILAIMYYDMRNGGDGWS